MTTTLDAVATVSYELTVPIIYSLDADHPYAYVLAEMSREDREELLREAFLGACVVKNVEHSLNEGASWAKVSLGTEQ